MQSAGGCDFSAGADPANVASALWTPQALPSVVTLTGHADGLADPSLSLPRDALGTVRAGTDNDLIIETLGAYLRIHRIGSVTGPLAALIPFDQLFDIRLASALRLWRALRGQKPGPDPGGLTAARRGRLILALRALDGRLAEASYREIAEVLFSLTRIRGREWKSHDVRDRTIRLVRYGYSLMEGGYRQLLLHPYRRR